MGLSLHKKRFDELTTQELYELLRIRTDWEFRFTGANLLKSKDMTKKTPRL